MTARFRDPIDAKACIIVSSPLLRCTSYFVPKSHSELAKMQGRFFADRRVEAYLYTTQPRFKRSKGEDDDTLGDGTDSEQKRFDGFAQ